MIKLLKNYLIKKLSIPQLVFVPKKRGFNMDVLFGQPHISREYFNFIYDHMVVESLNCDSEKFKAYQQLLIDLKILSDQHGSKIDYSS